MPFLRQPSAESTEQQDAAGPLSGNSAEVFFSPETGQIYEDYERYIESVVQKNQAIWTCKYTGKGGMTFWEAMESERRAQELLESFPETWKGPILRMVQHSHDSPDLIATQLVEFCKAHFLPGEYVRIDINADVRYWGEVLSAVHGMRPDGTDSSEYKVSLAAEPNSVTIGEASFVGTPPFTRLRNVPNKTLIKKFIKSVASRNLFPGAPWIVNADLVKKYGLKSELPAHLSAAAIRAARAFTATEGGSSNTSLPLAPSSEIISDDGPKPDEDVAHQSEVPQGTAFGETFVDKALDVWMFSQAFGPPLRLSPFTLKDLLQATSHDELPNPLLEAVHLALLAPVARERKTRGSDAVAKLLARSALAPEMADPDDMQVDDEDGPAVLDLLDKVKWWETPAACPWWVSVAALLREASRWLKPGHWTRSLLAGLEPVFLRQAAKGYLSFGPETRAAIQQFLVKLLEPLPLIRQHVDAQLASALEHRKDRRQLDIDRNKLAKEVADAERELHEASALETADPKALRKMEAALRRQQALEGQLARKSEVAFREERKASAFRTSALGNDRAYRRYWWLDFHLLGALIDGAGSNVLVAESAAGQWTYFDSEESVTALASTLSLKGARELRFHTLLERSLPLIVEDLRPFAPPREGEGDSHPVDTTAAEAEEPRPPEDLSEEELVVVPKRRGRRPKAPAVPTAQLPAFLRYRNTLTAKK